MPVRRIPFLAVASAVVAIAACENKKAEQAPLPTTAVTRGDIAVRVQATGTVEPINPVDIKSKAGGTVIQEPVEVGSGRQDGAICSRRSIRATCRNQFDQAMADDVVSATQPREGAGAISSRKDSLFAVPRDHRGRARQQRSRIADGGSADLVSRRATLDLRRQALEDATVTRRSAARS